MSVLDPTSMPDNFIVQNKPSRLPFAKKTRVDSSLQYLEASQAAVESGYRSVLYELQS